MSRDNTLITDPNSLFAISRAIRKTIVEKDKDPKHVNNAIRDEKHLAYKSTGKQNYENFKYDILTNLEQLDNYFLELETVLGKITEDEKILQEAVRASKGESAPKKRGRPKRSGTITEFFKKTGAGRYRGGVIPDLPADQTLEQAINDILDSDTVTDELKEVIQSFVDQTKVKKEEYDNGDINREELLEAIENIYNLIDESVLEDTDEEADLGKIYLTYTEYFKTLPALVKKEEEKEEEKPAPTSLKGMRRGIPIKVGNEFIVSTLSKINIILTKLIAEYNGKILINYKKFLQSDLEEIALKVIDSKKRFNELKDFLKDYEIGKQALDIDKFLEVIDKKFNQFLALSSRSIANFVNPNISFLPNFSQQLSESYSNPDKQFNIYQETQNAPIYEAQLEYDKYNKLWDQLDAQQIDIQTDIDPLFAEYNILIRKIRSPEEEDQLDDLTQEIKYLRNRKAQTIRARNKINRLIKEIERSPIFKKF
jgi:hypothetical protein